MSQLMLMIVARYPQEKLAVSHVFLCMRFVCSYAGQFNWTVFCIHTVFPADRIPHKQMKNPHGPPTPS